MKVLIFNEVYTPYQKGGAEVSTQLLAESIVKQGNEVHVCTTGMHDEESVVNGVIVHRLRERNVYWSFENEKQSQWKKMLWHTIEMRNFFAVRSITKVVERVCPDIIHTNVISGFSTVIWKIAYQHHIPVVHTMRDYYLMCLKATRFKNNRICINGCGVCAIYSMPKKDYSQYVDGVVGISNFILSKHLDQGYFPNRVTESVIHNSIVINDIPSCDNKGKVIGFLGRVHKSKGIELLLDAYSKLQSSYTLEIAGPIEPSYLNELKERYPSKCVKFLGKVNAYDFLSRISLLVVPSLWDEPFGRVIVEANACGCPVLVSNRGGMPELINGNNGLVFNLEEEDSLFLLLQDFVKHPFNYIPDDCNLKQYSMETICNKYISVYREVVSKKERHETHNRLQIYR